jgi:hypothetical protein
MGPLEFISLGRIPGEHYIRRTLITFLEREFCQTGESIHQSSWKKPAIWANSINISGRTLPSIAEFQVLHLNKDITTNFEWHVGTITLRIKTVSIKCTVAIATDLDGITKPTSTGATARWATLEGWQDLRKSHPELEEEMSVSPNGIIRPGLTIQAEIIRLDVRMRIVLELREGRTIWYPGQ